MIPKVNKYDFYLYSDFSNVDNPNNLLQLIAHSNEYFEDITLSSLEQEALSKRIELCQILFEDEWNSRNGKIQFFFEFSDKKIIEDYYKKLTLFANEFGFKSLIPNFQKTIKFYIENESEIRELSENQENDDWWDRLQKLQSEYNYYYSQAIEIVANNIIKKPNDFCRDENGDFIDSNFTGKLKHYLKTGILKYEYSIVKGQILGEFIEYDNNGNKRELSYKDGYYDKDSFKKWFENGQIEFEKINDSDYRYWFENGQIKTEKIGEIIRKWDINGKEIL
ncbi:hypothetical protein JM658_06685 [Joostella atrarenae]|uniref:Uncharacterized protein n=1 Tax=Joostella atrarenae TaxID=679257 RepID=A0ABS9J271_9FLAO|nr:hypothetical protein [Joostella atrarenae]MCF8714515.1 hypothetical protein [Joostella atrarenae]